MVIFNSYVKLPDGTKIWAATLREEDMQHRDSIRDLVYSLAEWK